MTYLYAAYAAAGLIIGGFVLHLVQELRRARRDLDEIKRRRPGP